jgi:hypothetical protein
MVMTSLWRDLRLALRGLSHSLTFTVGTTLVLAFGIGAGVGVLAALFAGRALGSQLYGVCPIARYRSSSRRRCFWGLRWSLRTPARGRQRESIRWRRFAASEASARCLPDAWRAPF